MTEVGVTCHVHRYNGDGAGSCCREPEGACTYPVCGETLWVEHARVMKSRMHLKRRLLRGHVTVVRVRACTMVLALTCIHGVAAVVRKLKLYFKYTL